MSETDQFDGAAHREDLREAWAVYGYVRCQTCEDEGNVETSKIDLEGAETFEEAVELFQEHAKQNHPEASADA